MPEINYRELLKRYMHNVLDCEGFAYIKNEYADILTPSDESELMAIYQEIRDGK